jgi:2'-5' RNA ligase
MTGTVAVPARRRRLFVAADLDAATRAACANAAERLRAAGFPGKWVLPENYHLTLAFLGPVDAARFDDVVDAVRAVASDAVSFDVALDRIGAFPTASRARVAWIGPSTPVPAFGRLSDATRRPLTALGFTFDAHADPHVTLARADGRAPLPTVTPPAVPPVRVDALVLYESVTSPSGARYTALHRCPFSA